MSNNFFMKFHFVQPLVICPTPAVLWEQGSVLLCDFFNMLLLNHRALGPWDFRTMGLWDHETITIWLMVHGTFGTRDFGTLEIWPIWIISDNYGPFCPILDPFGFIWSLLTLFGHCLKTTYHIFLYAAMHKFCACLPHDLAYCLLMKTGVFTSHISHLSIVCKNEALVCLIPAQGITQFR